MKTDGSLTRHAAALLGLASASYVLSTRYYTSAAFERPAHFTLITLLFSGAIFTVLSRWIGPSRSSRHLDTLRAPGTSAILVPTRYGGVPGERVASLVTAGLDKVRRLQPFFVFLLGCIVFRTFLFWSVLQTTQCAWSGVEAFLPCFVLVFDTVELLTPRLPISSRQNAPVTNAGFSKLSKSSLLYFVAALAWAFAAMSALSHSRITTGVICPVGIRLEPLIPYAQLTMCAIDAVIIVCLASLRRREMEDDIDISSFVATLFYVAACCVFLLPFPTWLIDSGFVKTFFLHYVDLRDLVLDSIFASFALVCSISLLTAFHPTTVAFVISSLGLFGFQMPTPIGAFLLLSPQSVHESTRASAIAAVLAGPLCIFALHPLNSSRPFITMALHRSLVISYAAILGVSVLCWFLLYEPWTNLPVDLGVRDLMTDAKRQAGLWQSQAAASRTLADAVAEYEERHALPPPPNFDKWYEFAVQHGSPVIDDFRQINDDLLPFWGLSPADIRGKTSQLLSYSILEMGGFRIRNGAVQQSPHIPGTHRWMTDSLEKMIEPFAKWLPDMDLAINLADECRVAVPFNDMKYLKYRARVQRGQTKANSQNEDMGLKQGSTKSLWPTDFPEPAHRKYKPWAFTNNIRRQIFYDWVADSCPPESRVQNGRWWDRSTVCLGCLEPHSRLTRDGTLMANLSLAFDLCHQPDVAYLDGFVMSPSAMVGTNALYPVFSQGRVGGFSDILIPSPWNFNEKSAYDDDKDMQWKEKKNGMFWRGSASDGFTSSGSWTSFTRARFVHEAYEWASALRPVDAEGLIGAESPLAVNVSFVGDLSKCTEGDCAAEMDAFELWGRTAMSNPEEEKQGRLPRGVPFEEHWHYKHLIDMDGAGFSGRFLPFLESQSLVYRVALFRTWFDERLQPWYHYVPIDIRLGRGFWAVLDFFAGARESPGSRSGDAQSGPASAQNIAHKGREWARQALRQEDMQIYMFRLLLEWGRVVDDDREHLGYTRV